MSRQLRNRLLSGIALMPIILVLATTIAAADAPYSETFDQTYALQADGRVSLENVNGSARIEVWDRAEVRVEAAKEASSQERLEALKIEVDARQDSVRIETRYPKSGSSWSMKDLFSGDGGGTSVTYTLTVPRGAKLDGIELVNGSLEITGPAGGVSADCVNGSITASDLGGRVELATVNGSIEMTAEIVDPGADLSLESVNGSIDLYLAPSVSAEVRAETVNGKIRNDFGFEVEKGKYVGSNMRGTVGGGGVDISLETVNGAISVHSR